MGSNKTGVLDFLVYVFGANWSTKFLGTALIVSVVSFFYCVVFEKQLFFSASTLANTLFQVTLQITGIYVITEYFKYSSENNKKQYELESLIIYQISPAINYLIDALEKFKKENNTWRADNLKPIRQKWHSVSHLLGSELPKFSLHLKRNLNELPPEWGVSDLDNYITILNVESNVNVIEEKRKKLTTLRTYINQLAS